eukprot:2664470-Amphidinium_carterae.1
MLRTCLLDIGVPAAIVAITTRVYSSTNAGLPQGCPLAVRFFGLLCIRLSATLRARSIQHRLYLDDFMALELATSPGRQSEAIIHNLE